MFSVVLMRFDLILPPINSLEFCSLTPYHGNRRTLAVPHYHHWGAVVFVVGINIG